MLFAVTVTMVAKVTAEGAVYTPEAETVPSAGETDQLTAAAGAPVRLAVNVWVCDASRYAVEGVMATVTAEGGGTTSAVAVEVPPLGNVAVTVTVCDVARLAGAVNRPVDETLPKFGLMLQRVAPCAVNC